MVKIVDPELHVEHVTGHAGQRRLVVTYGLDVSGHDVDLSGRAHEHAVVQACDEHDAPTRPRPVRFELDGEVELREVGVTPRRLERTVHRVDLDVEQDWWDTDEAGGTTPIAEWSDHLAATITVRVGNVEAARAETPVVTGSWGALGED